MLTLAEIMLVATRLLGHTGIGSVGAEELQLQANGFDCRWDHRCLRVAWQSGENLHEMTAEWKREPESSFKFGG